MNTITIQPYRVLPQMVKAWREFGPASEIRAGAGALTAYVEALIQIRFTATGEADDQGFTELSFCGPGGRAAVVADPELSEYDMAFVP